MYIKTLANYLHENNKNLFIFLLFVHVCVNVFVKMKENSYTNKKPEEIDGVSTTIICVLSWCVWTTTVFL